MKNNPLFVMFLLLIFYNCKTENKTKESVKETSILEKISNAHGFSSWKNVSELKFTFNVDRDTTHFERTWIWNTKNNAITAISATDTTFYNRKNMDSIARKTNSGFINDKYWLLAPFNLIWDKNNFTFTHTTGILSPIGAKKMQKLTIVYSDEGGYTPGDAYDFYFDDNYIIQEWVFRKGNQVEASMTTTWEDYIDKKGLKIASTFKKSKENFTLYFTRIKVKSKK
ncbi:MAG: hypothetical protein V3U92_09725 [Cellulophaga sp.]